MAALLTLEPQLLALSRAAQGPLLALDAATAFGSLCLVDAERGRVREVALATSAMPSESLALALAAELAAAERRVGELAGVVVGLGPGSFTGLRVALATVKGLAFASGVPVYGVSSLALIAAGAGAGLVLPVLDARRGEVFSALYDIAEDGVVQARLEDAARTPEALVAAARAYGPLTIVGAAGRQVPGLAELPGATLIDEERARAAAGLLMLRERIERRAADPLAAIVPRYLRLSEAERVRAAATP